MSDFETKSIITEVKNGDRRYLEKLYEKYRKDFGDWAAKHYKVDHEVTTEVYQKSFIAFYYNIKEGKLTQMSSSPKTYLFAIGKNILRDHFRAMAKFTESLDIVVDMTDIDHTITGKYEEADQKESVQKLLDLIGEPCKTVLEMFYFQDCNLKLIAAEMNYKTEQIAAKRKFICLKQLKAMLSGRKN